MNPKENNKRISRKKFFRWTAAALLVPMYYVWDNTVGNSRDMSSTVEELVVDPKLPDGYHFFGRVILVKDGAELRLLSSRCTHLGCRINKSDGGRLVCPCHGSEYNAGGVPVKGPAIKPLPEIPFEVTMKEGRMVLVFRV